MKCMGKSSKDILKFILRNVISLWPFGWFSQTITPLRLNCKSNRISIVPNSSNPRFRNSSNFTSITFWILPHKWRIVLNFRTTWMSVDRNTRVTDSRLFKNWNDCLRYWSVTQYCMILNLVKNGRNENSVSCTLTRYLRFKPIVCETIRQHNMLRKSSKEGMK